MLFSSMTFIYVFLPILSVSYLLFKKEFQNYILLIASIVFYAWVKPDYLVILFFIILVNYESAILIDNIRNKYNNNKNNLNNDINTINNNNINTNHQQLEENNKLKENENNLKDNYHYQLKIKLILILCISINLAFLFYFKYFNFFIDNINYIFKTKITIKNIILPIGISFYIFQAIGYVVDVYREEIEPQKDMSKFALYVSLFPKLTAGPIVNYKDIKDQLDVDKRKITLDNLYCGIRRFIIGLSKKTIIADTLGVVVDKIFNQDVTNYTTFIAWVGALSYTFQIYYDFSGYSDMAIGLATILGFKFPENFDYPYISKSITEYWRRWHISLGAWFRDYLYLPLGGNRCSKLRNYFNLSCVFLFTGIWHGANWTFVIWGLYNCFFNIIEKATKFYKKGDNYERNFSKIIHHIWTIFIIITGWIFFRSPNLKYSINYLKNMFHLIKNYNITYESNLYYFDRFEILIFIIAIICSLPIFKNIMYFEKKNIFLRILINSLLMFLLIYSTSSIAKNTYNAFIYFQF